MLFLPPIAKQACRTRLTDWYGEVMTSWYPGWQLAVAWLLTVVLAGLIYFVPVTTLLESVSDHSGTIAAAADGP